MAMHDGKSYSDAPADAHAMSSASQDAPAGGSATVAPHAMPSEIGGQAPLRSPAARARLRATLFVALASLLFALMALLAKRAAARLPGPEVALVRFLIGLGAVGLWATRHRLRAINRRGLLLRGVFGGAAVATIREVRRTDGSFEIFGAFCLVGALFTAPPTLAHFVRPNRVEWLLLFAVGAISVLAQLLMTWALKHVRATVAGIIMQLTPAAALGFGVLLFHEPAPVLALVGAAITLAGVTWGARLASL